MKEKKEKEIAQFLGENLKRIRTEKGVSRKILAEMLGVTDVAIGQYENGLRTPTAEKAAALADFLKVSITDFVSVNSKIIDKKIFEYRLQRAYQMARDFLDSLLNAEPNFDNEGHVVIYSPSKIIFEKGGVHSYHGNTNAVAFKTKEDFVKVMEQAEFEALLRQVHFNTAFRHIVFGSEFYRVIDE